MRALGARVEISQHSEMAAREHVALRLAITRPVPETVTRILALVDEFVLVGDEDLRSAVDLIAETLGILVEPAGAAGVAALRRHGQRLTGERTAALLTGARTSR